MPSELAERWEELAFRSRSAIPTLKQFEEQLGLSIEKAKIFVQYFVVDHLERPSEN
jgi:uncharacterized protein (TIGR03435 family)